MLSFFPDFVSTVFNWLKSSLHQFFLLLILLVVVFLGLLKYPVELHTESLEVKDQITIKKEDTYVVHTELNQENGAVVSFSKHTYFSQIKNNDS